MSKCGHHEVIARRAGDDLVSNEIFQTQVTLLSFNIKYEWIL